MIIQFPLERARHDHARRSIKEGSARRDASAANLLSDNPAFRPRAERTIADQYSDGILSRCGHFRAAATLAPISIARAPGEDQSAMTSLNVSGPAMDSGLGHCVLNRKANLSYDCRAPRGQNQDMAKSPANSDFLDAFIERVREARASRFPTQTPMLTILGIDQGTYKQYESRTPLPTTLIPKFCAACGIDQNWLFTGVGKGPKLNSQQPEKEKRTRPQRRRKAA